MNYRNKLFIQFFLLLALVHCNTEEEQNPIPQDQQKNFLQKFIDAFDFSFTDNRDPKGYNLNETLKGSVALEPVCGKSFDELKVTLTEERFLGPGRTMASRISSDGGFIFYARQPFMDYKLEIKDISSKETIFETKLASKDPRKEINMHVKCEKQALARKTKQEKDPETFKSEDEEESSESKTDDSELKVGKLGNRKYYIPNGGNLFKKK